MCRGARYKVDRGFDIPWVEVQNAIASGFDIPWERIQNVMSREFNIPWIRGLISHE
jgi:hypothetical protein